MTVNFKSSGQMVPASVMMLRPAATGLIVDQVPLPQIGSWGLVAFPYGDTRNGIWLGSYYPSMQDALTTTQASGFAPTDGFIDYDAHFSGWWRLLDGLGNEAIQWPDGSYFTAAATSGLPQTYRHTVVNNQQQQIPYTRADRIPNPPSTFPFTFVHNSGTLFSFDASGNVTVSGATNATLTFDFGVAKVQMASGNVNIIMPSGDALNVSQSGMSASDAAVLTSKMVTAFNAHTHQVTGVQTGSSTVTSQTPTSAISASTINSAIVNLSN